MGKKKPKIKLPDGTKLSKKEWKEVKRKAKDLTKIIEQVWDQYVPKGHCVEVYAVPIEKSKILKKNCDLSGIPLEQITGTDNWAGEKDLTCEDWTKEDVFEMMTDAELRGYDYLDNRAHNVKANLPEDRRSFEAQEERMVDYEEARGDIIQMMIEFEAAVSGFLYAVNSDAPDWVLDEASADLDEVLEMVELYGRMYEFEDELAFKKFQLGQTEEKIDELEIEADGIKDEIELLDAGYEDAWTAIHDFAERYPYDDDED